MPVRDDGELDMDALSRLLAPRTRMVALSHMSNVAGRTVNPAPEIVAGPRGGRAPC